MSPDRIYAKYWVELGVSAAEGSGGDGRRAVVGHLHQSAGRDRGVEESPCGAGGESTENRLGRPLLRCPGRGCRKGPQCLCINAARRSCRGRFNMGASLQNLMATVAGNLSELQQFSGLKLLDMTLPQPFRDKYAGPQFGVAGTRRLTGVPKLPLVGTIIKPSVGLSPEATAGMVKQLAQGGIDFIKDDELQADGPHCPFEDRVVAVMRVIHENAARTGKKVMFAFNVTGDLDEMRRRHDFVLAQGGTCVMVSVNGVGLTGVVELRRHAQLPIHGHRTRACTAAARISA